MHGVAVTVEVGEVALEMFYGASLSRQDKLWPDNEYRSSERSDSVWSDRASCEISTPAAMKMAL